MSLQAVKKPSYNNIGHRLPFVFLAYVLWLHKVYQIAARAQVFICSAVISVVQLMVFHIIP